MKEHLLLLSIHSPLNVLSVCSDVQAPLTLTAPSGLMIFLSQPFLMYALTLHVQAKNIIIISLWKTQLYVYLY